VLRRFGVAATFSFVLRMESSHCTDFLLRSKAAARWRLKPEGGEPSESLSVTISIRVR
jgi:hypothetical protein